MKALKDIIIPEFQSKCILDDTKRNKIKNELESINEKIDYVFNVFSSRLKVDAFETLLEIQQRLERIITTIENYNNPVFDQVIVGMGKTKDELICEDLKAISTFLLELNERLN